MSISLTTVDDEARDLGWPDSPIMRRGGMVGLAAVFDTKQLLPAAATTYPRRGG